MVEIRQYYDTYIMIRNAAILTQQIPIDATHQYTNASLRINYYSALFNA